MQEYDMLAKYLEEMIKDGCQIVHGGNLIDWSDTAIPKVLSKIDQGKKELQIPPNLRCGDQLRHKLSGQNMTIIEIDGEKVHLNPDEIPIKYPITQILEEFEVMKRSKKKPIK